jgi:hypothetical protein
MSQRNAEGAKWSCGFRNIQNLCGALIKESAEYKGKLFNKTGEIPDIYGIQSWIEKAWKAGYEREGGAELDFTLLGTDKWIGACECAALLRFFGIRAFVVTFQEKKVKKDGKKRKYPDFSTQRTCGFEFKRGDIVWHCIQCAKDSFDDVQCNTCHNRSDHTGHQAYSEIYRDDVGGFCDCGDQKAWSLNGTCCEHIPAPECREGSNLNEVNGIDVEDEGDKDSIGKRLFTWVKKYYSHNRVITGQSSATSSSSITKFFDNNNEKNQENREHHLSSSSSSSTSRQESQSEETTGRRENFPLYFQHDGHSRTIVGYEISTKETNSILVLDPLDSGQYLKQSLLSEINGTKSTIWKNKLKRSVKGKQLDKGAYQIVYVVPGNMSTAEQERSKILPDLSDLSPMKTHC